ncbi:MAG: hypothetical protein NDF55_04685 [archaeon GB-1867-005]|nr:hypothetical protein [Candidatus Culexmicrobium cathedralense]
MEDVLKGKTLLVYRYMLKVGRPVGVREIQRALKFSSPSLAHYHLSKLQEAGLIGKNRNGLYEIQGFVKVDVLYGLIKIGRLTLPRYFFYAIFFASTFLLLLYSALKSQPVTGFHIFSLSVCAIAFISWIYEAIRLWRKWL